MWPARKKFGDPWLRSRESVCRNSRPPVAQKQLMLLIRRQLTHSTYHPYTRNLKLITTVFSKQALVQTAIFNIHTHKTCSRHQLSSSQVLWMWHNWRKIQTENLRWTTQEAGHIPTLNFHTLASGSQFLPSLQFIHKLSVSSINSLKVKFQSITVGIFFSWPLSD